MIDPITLQQGTDWQAQAEVFEEIFFVFLSLGTLVGIVVVSYRRQRPRRGVRRAGRR
jgi:cytochrome c oxidase subunit 2